VSLPFVAAAALLAALLATPPAATAAPAAITTPGEHRGTLRHGGLERRYRLHVPARRDPATPAPLVVALHGGGGNMDWQADDARYGLISASERHGFVVVFPNGTGRRGGDARLATWNAGRCCGSARERGVDDVGFIRALVERLTAQFHIDRRRVYATGMSNGGLMAYRLACEAADVFSAIAPVAGTDNTQSCTPSRPVSVLHIHARDDTHVLYDGGAGPDAVDMALITPFTSVPDTIARWTRLDGCPAEPRRLLERPGARCDAWAPCRAGTRVQLCVTGSGGHSWPGAQRTRRKREPASQALSTAETMWQFFAEAPPR